MDDVLECIPYFLGLDVNRVDKLVQDVVKQVVKYRAYPIVDVMLKKRVLVIRHTNGFVSISGRRAELKKMARIWRLVPLDAFID